MSQNCTNASSINTGSESGGVDLAEGSHLVATAKRTEADKG